MRYIVFIVLYFYVGLHYLFAISNHHILRKSPIISRENADPEILEAYDQYQKEYEILEKKIKKSTYEHIVYLHNPIMCSAYDQIKPDKKVIAIRNQTQFNYSNFSKNPLNFFFFIEAIYAHLEISKKIYQHGKVVNLGFVRSHSDEEYLHYDDSILDKEEFPDYIRSLYYIKYVMMPILDKVGAFYTPQATQKFKAHLDMLIQMESEHKTYNQCTSIHQKLADTLEDIKNAYRRKHNIQYDNRFQVKMTMKFLREILISYRLMLYCPQYSPLIDPVIDPFDIDLPDHHDNHLMGYALNERMKKFLKSEIYNDDNPNSFMKQTDSNDPENNMSDRAIIKNVLLLSNDIFPHIISQNRSKTSLSQLYRAIKKMNLMLIKRINQ